MAEISNLQLADLIRSFHAARYSLLQCLRILEIVALGPTPGAHNLDKQSWVFPDGSDAAIELNRSAMIAVSAFLREIIAATTQFEKASEPLSPAESRQQAIRGYQPTEEDREAVKRIAKEVKAQHPILRGLRRK